MKNKFADHQVNKTTRILLLGTFHADIKNKIDFFGGANENYLWAVLPGCFGQPSLKNSSLRHKQLFMKINKVDFADIISELDETHPRYGKGFGDEVLDATASRWTDLEMLAGHLPELEAVYFLRKTLNRVPRMENRIAEIRNHCVENKIRFCLLESTLRCNVEKTIQGWKDAMICKKICR
jgi:hypothetical protein